MSVITTVILQSEGFDIPAECQRNGFVHPGTLTSRSGEKVFFESVLDFSACNPEEWSREKEKILEHGVVCVQCGGESRRRDYTAEEISELHLFPVAKFRETGGIIAHINYDFHTGDDIIFYLTTAFQDRSFKVLLETEGQVVFDGVVQNGKEISGKGGKC